MPPQLTRPGALAQSIRTTLFHGADTSTAAHVTTSPAASSQQSDGGMPFKDVNGNFISMSDIDVCDGNSLGGA